MSRFTPATKAEVRRRKLNAATAELVRSSRLEVQHTPRSFIQFRFSGPLAKIPSTSNSKLSWIPKAKLFKLLGFAMSSGPMRTMSYLRQAMAELKELRPILGKDPEHQNALAAMTALWLKNTPENFQPLASSIDHRLFVLTLCDESLRMTDTHNVNKAVCDWLQRIGVYENDRHVDALALRLKDFYPDATGTWISVMSQTQLLARFGSVRALLADCAESLLSCAPEPLLVRASVEQCELFAAK